MNDLVIETSGLRKVYRSAGRRVVAVDGLDLEVPAGGVHGFLGPNGSGKTTTIRMLLGLARPTKGSIRMFGLDVPGQLPRVLERVGAIVEEPRFVPGFSGRKNLRLLARTIGAPRSAVGSSLEQVGLTDRARESYRGYSLGMRQRLAIAAALLKSPDLLILDEPTNGLDPAGIQAIREMIRDLGESGVTVLLSSHILAEVQQVCHSVSIVGDGRLLAAGRVEDLLGQNVLRTRVGVTDPQGAQHFLEAAGHTVTREGDLLLVEGHRDPEQLTRLLADKGVFVRELTPVRPSLESFFLKLTGRAGSTTAPTALTAPEAPASLTPAEGAPTDAPGGPPTDPTSAPPRRSLSGPPSDSPAAPSAEPTGPSGPSGPSGPAEPTEPTEPSGPSQGRADAVDGGER